MEIEFNAYIQTNNPEPLHIPENIKNEVNQVLQHYKSKISQKNCKILSFGSFWHFHKFALRQHFSLTPQAFDFLENTWGK